MGMRRMHTAQLLISFLATLAVAACIAVVGVGQVAAAPHTRTSLPIESIYRAPGPWKVTARTGFSCCDAGGGKLDVFYPTKLGARGVRHPIITWGNGTLADTSKYSYLLRHLASWGFVVIATQNEFTNSGADIRAAASYLVKQNSTPGSRFYQKLDTSDIAAVGRSQGASGALNAMMDSNGAIKTAIPIEMPAQRSCSSGTCTDPGRLRSGSVFYVNGSADGFISPSFEPNPWSGGGLQSLSAFYQATPDSVAKVWATLNGADHNDIQGKPTCWQASWPCAHGVTGYLGYLTAWLMAQLRDDARAQSVFVRDSGELFHHPGWSNQSSNITA